MEEEFDFDLHFKKSDFLPSLVVNRIPCLEVQCSGWNAVRNRINSCVRLND